MGSDSIGMTDPKYDKALRTIASLKKVVEHPNTGDGERAAAQGRIDALKAKWNIADTPPPRAKPSPPRDRTGGFNSTAGSGFNIDDMEEWLRNFQRGPREETEAQKQARRIAEEKRQYERWQRANEAMLRRQAAQKAWEERNRARDANGVPLTDEEREEARRDPLGWAARRDGRTEAQKNQDMQDQYTHAWERAGTTSGGSSRSDRPNKCSKPLPYFTSGGEPRKRNEYPTYCHVCGVNLKPGEGAIFMVGKNWVGQCCEMVPGPRKKKPGRG